MSLTRDWTSGFARPMRSDPAQATLLNSSVRQLHPGDPMGQRPARRGWRDGVTFPECVGRALRLPTGCAGAWSDDFASIHVFHLRGDIRKNMLSGGRAGEGENVFGQGSMTGIAISVFVKNSGGEGSKAASCSMTSGTIWTAEAEARHHQRASAAFGASKKRTGWSDDHTRRTRRLA